LLANRALVVLSWPVDAPDNTLVFGVDVPVFCTTVVGRTFHLVPPDDVAAVLGDLNDRLAFPYSEFLAQGLIAFATRRQFRPWGAPMPKS